jgi:hypothetical protein
VADGRARAQSRCRRWARQHVAAAAGVPAADHAGAGRSAARSARALELLAPPGAVGRGAHRAACSFARRSKVGLGDPQARLRRRQPRAIRADRGAVDRRQRSAPATTGAPTSTCTARTTPGVRALSSARLRVVVGERRALASRRAPPGRRSPRTVPGPRASSSALFIRTLVPSRGRVVAGDRRPRRPPRSGWQIGQNDSGKPCSSHQSPLAWNTGISGVALRCRRPRARRARRTSPRRRAPGALAVPGARAHPRARSCRRRVAKIARTTTRSAPLAHATHGLPDGGRTIFRSGLHFRHCDSGRPCSSHQSPVALNAGHQRRVAAGALRLRHADARHTSRRGARTRCAARRRRPRR